MAVKVTPVSSLVALGWIIPLVAGHACLMHPSMWGYDIFSATDSRFSYDNRPVAPLQQYTFDQWWFHGHLDYPPESGQLMDLPAGGKVTTEIACNRGATSFFEGVPGGDIQAGDSVCPGQPTTQFHTTGLSDVKGCGLGIAYESDISKIQPEDITMFSINQTCVWSRFTDFQIPKNMPPCPEGGCICAWFWIHNVDAGSEQIYMNGFRCDITGSSSNVPLSKPQVTRKCGADPFHKIEDPTPSNCTYGAKQPLYWLQKERNNIFTGYYDPPFYNDEWGFKDGAQEDIFQDSLLPYYVDGKLIGSQVAGPTPSPPISVGGHPSPTAGLVTTFAGSEPTSTPAAESSSSSSEEEASTSAASSSAAASTSAGTSSGHGSSSSSASSSEATSSAEDDDGSSTTSSEASTSQAGASATPVTVSHHRTTHTRSTRTSTQFITATVTATSDAGSSSDSDSTATITASASSSEATTTSDSDTDDVDATAFPDPIISMSLDLPPAASSMLSGLVDSLTGSPTGSASPAAATHKGKPKPKKPKTDSSGRCRPRPTSGSNSTSRAKHRKGHKSSLKRHRKTKQSRVRGHHLS